MTNAQINLQNAIEAMNAGKLTEWESNFIKGIQHYDKKALRGLSSKQYDVLVKCSGKNQ